MIHELESSFGANVATQRAAGSVFGLTFDKSDVVETVERLVTLPAKGVGRARLFVTPNIQHIAEMRSSPELYRTIREADLVTCDGFPLAAYARWNGCTIAGRITGRDVVEHMMLRTDLDERHVLYFLIESSQTAAAVERWARARNMADRVVVEVAPPRFGENEDATLRFARRVRDAGTTLLFLGLGAPKSELFAGRYRAVLGDCWALCIGQSVRVALGLVPPPSGIWVKLHLEWAWRLAREPRRLARRYAFGSAGFVSAVFAEQVLGKFSGRV